MFSANTHCLPPTFLPPPVPAWHARLAYARRPLQDSAPLAACPLCRAAHHARQCWGASKGSTACQAQQRVEAESDPWQSWAASTDTPRLPSPPAAGPPPAGTPPGNGAWSAAAEPQAAEGDRASPAGTPDWQTDLRALASTLRGDGHDGAADASPGAPSSSSPVSSELDEPERAFLVGVLQKGTKNKYGYSLQDSLAELGRLADTAGLQVVGQTTQQLEAASPRTYIGSGKVTELSKAVAATRADTVIFDDELSPGQLRNLEKVLGDKVALCDRTALILDIFSQRAATREGQLQVELARSEYQLPRLTRMWAHLERQAGGRVRGMGEKQIEVDKRLLRERMALLRRQLEEVRTHRAQYRRRRAEAPMPVAALVGYTNAGKSTLLNALTEAGVLAEDRLFATLDPTTRRVRLPSGKEILFSDTVGFIQKLPTQLVAAFRATLEEIRDAALLLHVVDVSHANAAAQAQAVDEVLAELGVSDVPLLTVWNKVDACAAPDAVRAVAAQRPNTICISAATGAGLPELMAEVERRVQAMLCRVDVLVPYDQGELMGEIRRTGAVEKEEFTSSGALCTAYVPLALAARLAPLALDGKAAQTVEAARRRLAAAEVQEDGWVDV